MGSSQWVGLVTSLAFFKSTNSFVMIPGQTCGITDAGLRIVGGSESANSTQFPWQARFKPCFQATITTCSLCGATVISPKWLVSAAHCTQALGSIQIVVGVSSVRLGGVRQNGADSEQTRVLSEIIDHPDYTDVASGHDITLLRMAIGVGMSENLHPACLPRTDDCFREGSETWISGFGVTEYDGNVPQQQKYAMVPIFDIDVCRSVYGNFDIDTQVCAGFPEGGTDACQGDSGGPLALAFEDVWYLYGVTSYGFECATAGYPGVYARVTNYVDWILNETSTNVQIYSNSITADYARANPNCPCSCADGKGETQYSIPGMIPGQSNGNGIILDLPCDSSPCQNGGTCSETQDFTSYTCTCAHEFTGADCDQTQIPGAANEIYDFHFDNTNVEGALDFVLGDNSEILRDTTAYVFFYYRLSNVNFLINGPNRKKRNADDVIDAIRDYGCWCPRALNGEGFGHAGVPLDDVDMFCKKWSQCNHCVSMNDCGSDSTNFTISFNPAADSYTCDAANQCAQDLCTCNGEFATSVARYLSDNGQNLESSFVDIEAEQCDHGRSSGRKDSCCGVSPTWVPFNSGVEQCDAGVLTKL